MICLKHEIRLIDSFVESRELESYGFTLEMIAKVTPLVNLTIEKKVKVEIKPDIVHWHGTAPSSGFVHLGISTQLTKGPAVWHEPVTDDISREIIIFNLFIYSI